MKPADEELELSRLLAAEAEGLGRDVALLREQGPDATQLASLASRLSLQGVPVAPAPTAASGSAPQPWKKWAFGGASGVSALLLWLALRAPQPLAGPAHIGGDATEPGPEQPSLATANSKAQTAERAQRSPGAAHTPPTAVAPNPAPEATTGSPTPAPVIEPAPRANEPTTSSPKPPIDAQTTPPSSTRPRPGNALPAAGLATSPGLTPSPAGAPSEIELLRDARFALKQSPARALELTEQHARLHPGGKLTQERELIAITALVALGRRTAALSRGASFERAFPTSPYRKQVDELLR